MNTPSSADQPSFEYHGGRLHAGMVDLVSMAHSVGTPCYVYNVDRVLANFQRVRDAFPQAEIHYSLKANANLGLVRELIKAGAGIDAVSGGEIFKAIEAGAAPQDIVFAGVGKTLEELMYAVETGVGWINVESSLELARIAQFAEEMGKKPRVALRLNPDVQANTHHYIATGHAAAKFGIPLTEALSLLDSYAASEAVSIEGLHLHIGSQLQSVDQTVEAARSVLPLFEAYPTLNTLDLGGGFPVSYNGEPIPPIEAFADALRSMFEGRGIHLLLEPGRYLVADAGLLLVEVQYVKPAPDGHIVVTDGGMTELIRPALYGAIHDVLPLRQDTNHHPLVRTWIVGPVCESADVLRSDVMFPPVQPGDLLAVLHAGAYGAVMGSTYNARPRPPEVLVKGSEWQIARRRETWRDLIALETEDAAPPVRT